MKIGVNRAGCANTAVANKMATFWYECIGGVPGAVRTGHCANKIGGE